MLLAIDWGSVGIKALQFILSFSILVTFHELGHFVTAKWFKCRVDKFYLFFDPWFSLFKKKVGDTEYGIGWLPLGGYVKISGMVDESMDKEQLKQPPQPYEFRSKPAWQRLIIMVAGVFINVVLAIVIFIGITWVWGEEYIPVQNIKYGVYADSLGVKVGVKDGDKIIAVGGKPIERLGEATGEILMNEPKEITVERDGQKINLSLPPGFVGQLNRNRGQGFTIPRFPVVVDSVIPKAKIISGTIQKGDTLIGYNGKPIKYSSDLPRNDDSLPKNTNINLQFLRNGKDTVHATVFADKSSDYYIGYKGIDKVLGTKKISYSFAKSIPIGFNKCWETLGRYIGGIKRLFSSKEIKVKDSLGGIVSIGNAFPGVWDWQIFWSLTGVFSIILAFMNILPIPALDGGHALFCIAEIITGRKPGDKFLEYAQMVGMVLLLSLMVYALGLDVWRIFK